MAAKEKLHYYTPSEILDMYPQLRTLFTPQKIGYLIYGGAVNYHKLGRQTLVEFEDFARHLKQRYRIVLD